MKDLRIRTEITQRISSTKV